jgi:pimeloyl-ACP methyl ester carboxylesterase
MSTTPTSDPILDQSSISGSRSFQPAETVAGGIRFHYLHQGAGFPVILLPGLPQSSYAWRKVIPELASEYRVFAIDLPGQGDSCRLSE